MNDIKQAAKPTKKELLQELFNYAAKLRHADAEDWLGAGYRNATSGNYPAVILGNIHFQNSNVRPRIMIKTDDSVVALSDGMHWEGRRKYSGDDLNTYYYTRGMRWTVDPHVPKTVMNSLETYRDLFKEACQKLADGRLKRQKISGKKKSA